MNVQRDNRFDPLRTSNIQSLSFVPFSDEEIENLSVVKIITPLTFDALGNPLPGGLYDPRLGPYDTTAGVCPTCNNLGIKCTGHFGHIELPLPVINPVFLKTIASVFRVMCMSCGRVNVHPTAKILFASQVKLLERGFIAAAQDLTDKFEILPASEDTKIEAAEKINETVNVVLSSSLIGDVVEARGDGHLRTQYLRFLYNHMLQTKKCPKCHHVWKTFSMVGRRMYTGSRSEASSAGKSKSSCGGPLLVSDAQKLLRSAWQDDSELLGAMMPFLRRVKCENPTDALFLTNILVPPTVFRPVQREAGMLVEHRQNAAFSSILNAAMLVKTLLALNSGVEMTDESKVLGEAMFGRTPEEKLANGWDSLQNTVTALLEGADTQRGGFIFGIKQIIEQKMGIVRMNMMGKRVDFAARSVITPDPLIGVDEVGVPGEFAMRLTYPTPVTQWNVEELRRRIINGPNRHPGAVSVQNEDGKIIRLQANDLSQREAVAKKLLTLTDPNSFKIVNRHLVNGDILLLNRQPTLHRPSIMAHRARILLGERTFRLHYSNCKSYNADFDGDEMNAHFPQNEIARSEAYNLVAVGEQYLVPKDGSPLGGLIQDHVVAAVRMTVRGKFFTQQIYHQLVYQALTQKLGHVQLLPPSMLKPQVLWSGKQVVSTVLRNVIPRGSPLINLRSTSKISSKSWEQRKKQIFDDEGLMSEASVIFQHGELLLGVLDKVHCGATPFGLIHSVYELYGGSTACFLLSAFSRLFTAFLQIEGFTLGVKDILVTKEANRQRWRILREAKNVGLEAAARALHCSPEDVTPAALETARHCDPDFRAVLDAEYKRALDSYTNEVNRTCLGEGLVSKFPENNLQLMVLSGAKGSTVNTMQISCLLGQIELEGRRPPLCITGRALPSFRPYDTSPRAGGFVDARFMTGIKPQEFFFHCMAGREGLIDTACKTSRSGYLQRCLVKHLEGLIVAYDGTVRDSDNCVIQWLYGEDGLDVCRSQLLNKLPLLASNLEALPPSRDAQIKELLSAQKAVKKWNKRHKKSGRRKQSAFALFSSNYPDPLANKPLIMGRTSHALEVCQKWNSLPSHEKAFFNKMTVTSPDCVTSKYQPSASFGAVSEKLDAIIKNYVKEAGVGVADKIEKAALERARASTVNAGDPVGLLAAQSVGEPSTQMTLNTFHFAGRGEMNVTLGIPRLRELLMVASANIKTPAVDIPLRSDLPHPERVATKLKMEVNRIYLSDVLENVTIVEDFEIVGPQRFQTYVCRLKFLPKKVLSEFTHISPKAIIRYVEKKFVKELTTNIKRKQSSIHKLITNETDVKRKKNIADSNEDEQDGFEAPRESGAANTGDNYASSDEEPQADDEDATAARRRERHNEEQQYSDIEDIEDEEVVRELADEEDEEINDEDGQAANKASFVDDAEPSSSGTSKMSVVEDHNNLKDYRYDSHKYRWCELHLNYCVTAQRVDLYGLVKELATQSIVYQVPGIRRGHIVQPKNDGVPVLRTEGVNLRWAYERAHLLDVDKLYSNDIHAISQTYGIEAAARVLVKEIEAVFEVYGIKVDRRHLSLISDYMTWSGKYIPLNRKGMEGGISPLQQVSFESALMALKNSFNQARSDQLNNPSARLMVGRPIQAGTGYCSALPNLKSLWAAQAAC